MKQSHIEAIAKAKLVQARQQAHLTHMNAIGAISSPKIHETRQYVDAHIKSNQEQALRDRY